MTAATEPAILLALLGAAMSGWLLAVAGWVAFLLERDRRKSAERSGRYRPKAVHRAADTAEQRTRKAVQQAETQQIKSLAAELGKEAKEQGIKVSQKELEAEAKRLLAQAGTGRRIG